MPTPSCRHLRVLLFSHNLQLFPTETLLTDSRGFAALLSLTTAAAQNCSISSCCQKQQTPQQQPWPQQQQRLPSDGGSRPSQLSQQWSASCAAVQGRPIDGQQQTSSVPQPWQQLRGTGATAWLASTLQSSSGSSTSRSSIPWSRALGVYVTGSGLACGQAHYSTSSSSSPAAANSGDNKQSSSSGGSGSSSSSSPPSSWLMRALPPACVPFAQLMRLDKPIGSWLLAWPGLWSIGLVAAPGHLPDPWLTALFGTGAVLMRGAGCTINDLWDRDIDKQVERTRSRPLAAGTVTPLAALVFLGAQLSASLAILLQLNMYTQVLGVASLSLVATYPLMKRITWWPQAFLGLCMNYGVLMGYSAAAGACDWAVVAPLYAAGVSWTLIYDTIYAHQDKRDDAVVGVKSTALLFGDRTKSWAAGFAVTQTLGMLLAGQAAGCGLPYFAGVAAGAAHIAWQIRTVDLQDGPDCMAKFVSNQWYGGLIYAGIVLDRLLAVAA